eukprot:g2667.t1
MKSAGICETMPHCAWESTYCTERSEYSKCTEAEMSTNATLCNSNPFCTTNGGTACEKAVAPSTVSPCPTFADKDSCEANAGAAERGCQWYQYSGTRGGWGNYPDTSRSETILTMCTYTDCNMYNDVDGIHVGCTNSSFCYVKPKERYNGVSESSGECFSHPFSPTPGVANNMQRSTSGNISQTVTLTSTSNYDNFVAAVYLGKGAYKHTIRIRNSSAIISGSDASWYTNAPVSSQAHSGWILQSPAHPHLESDDTAGDTPAMILFYDNFLNEPLRDVEKHNGHFRSLNITEFTLEGVLTPGVSETVQNNCKAYPSLEGAGPRDSYTDFYERGFIVGKGVKLSMSRLRLAKYRAFDRDDSFVVRGAAHTRWADSNGGGYGYGGQQQFDGGTDMPYMWQPGAGGALYLMSGSETVLDHMCFEDNGVRSTWPDTSYLQYTGTGGAIFVDIGATLTVRDTLFRGNYAVCEVRAFGGAIALTSSSVTIQGSFFDGNFATDGGGAVFARREGGSQDFTLDIRNTTFTRNFVNVSSTYVRETGDANGPEVGGGGALAIATDNQNPALFEEVLFDSNYVSTHIDYHMNKIESRCNDDFNFDCICVDGTDPPTATCELMVNADANTVNSLKSTMYGGAVLFNSDVIFRSTTFRNNQAYYDGVEQTDVGFGDPGHDMDARFSDFRVLDSVTDNPNPVRGGQPAACDGNNVRPSAICDSLGLNGWCEAHGTFGVTCKAYIIVTTDSAQQLPIQAETIDEGTTLTLYISASMDHDVGFAIHLSSDNPKCQWSTSTLNFSSSEALTPQVVQMTALENDIDEGSSGTAGFTCTLNSMFAVQSNPHPFNSIHTHYDYSVQAIDNDQADAFMQLEAQGGGYEYELKLMGPIVLTEGASQKFAIVLATEPTEPVAFNLSVDIRNTSPLQYNVTPREVTFEPGVWNIPQLITLLTVDDDVDNDLENEEINLIYSVVSDDATFVELTANLQIIARVTDNDDAGVVTDVNGLLQFTEGDTATVTFNIQGLATRPSADVDLTISLPETLEFVSGTTGSLTVSQDSWNSMESFEIGVRVRSDVAITTNNKAVIIQIEASSTDPVYNAIPPHVVQGTIATAQGQLVFTGQKVEETEGKQFSYTVSLNIAPISEVQLVLLANTLVCAVSPTSLTFDSANSAIPQTITISLHKNSLRKPIDEVVGVCTVEHAYTSTDAKFDGSTALSIDSLSAGCAPGNFSDTQAGVDTCRKCLSGTYKADEGGVNEGACVTCEEGSDSVAGSKRCVCAAGKYWGGAYSREAPASLRKSLQSTRPSDDPNWTPRWDCRDCPGLGSQTICNDLDTHVSDLLTGPGFWRPPQEPNVSLFYECKSQAYCVGGRIGRQCDPNREGPLCWRCKIGYTDVDVPPGSNSTCKECPSDP